MQAKLIENKVVTKERKKGFEISRIVVSGTALAILQIRGESLDQKGLWLQIASDLSICFIQSMKKA